MKLHRLFGGILAGIIFLAARPLFSQQGSQGDVYAVTRHFSDTGWVYRYWKNGQNVQHFSTDGYSLGERCEVGGDVYELGQDETADGTSRAFVSKNGKRLYFLSDGSYDTGANFICVSGGDVYVGGGEGPGDGVGAVWKNGKRLLHQLDDGGVLCLFVSGGDLYVGGYLNQEGGFTLATVWKNGKVHQKLVGNNIRSLFVLGNDLFAAGSGENKTVVWKNGKLHQTLNDGSVYASVLSLCVSGGNVYTGGYEYDSDGNQLATVWKNGNLLYRLGDDAHVALVFVKDAAPAASASVITGTIPLDGVGDTVIKYEVRHEGKQVIVTFDATGLRFSGHYSDAAASGGGSGWGIAEVCWELQGTSNITNADRTLATTYLPGNETMLGMVYKVKDPKRPVVLGTLVYHSVTQ